MYMIISHLFAGKPQLMPNSKTKSSIIKQPHNRLTIEFDGAVEDEQGNKKLHGGPFMALHQYSQSAYKVLSSQFDNPSVPFEIGTIGENISAPDMTEHNVYIGDLYTVGSAEIQVVSPRAPCARINQRYTLKGVDKFIYENDITGWYFKVIRQGHIEVGDSMVKIDEEDLKISVAQIWQLRKMIKQPNSDDANKELVEQSLSLNSLAPEWLDYMHRAIKKLSDN